MPYRGRRVTGTAFSLGFNCTAHFARVFKKRYGLTPTGYRNMHAERLGLPRA